MANINISNLSFSYNNNYEAIFTNVSLQLDSDWKLGLIGRNGKGKTTFFKLLTNQLEYRGSIDSTISFESFPFTVNNQDNLVSDLFLEYLYDVELWQIKKELNLLNIDDGILYQPYNLLSGGQQVKIMLAILFLKPNCFLLIDEPTNHLDIEGRQIVSEYLNKKTGFILISHDRQFLNNCVDHIMSINNETITVHQGNYDTWKENKDNQDLFELKQNEKLKKDIKKLDLSAKRTAKWSNEVEKTKNLGKSAKSGKLDQGVKPDKGHIGAMAAKMMKRSISAQNRKEKALEDKRKLLKEIEVIEPLKLNYLNHHNKTLVEFIDVSLYYDKRIVKDNINFTIQQQERIALVGSNGSGKTSIIKALVSNIKQTGTINKASNLKIDYVAQDTSFLKGSLQTFIKENNLDESKFKAILRKLGFSRNQFTKSLDNYSSGQKKKVLIARSLCEEAHLYIWDEALNYLDIISRIQLENVILEYQPTMLFVEHDQEFLANIATDIVYLDI